MLPFEHILLGLFPMIHLWLTFDPLFGILFVLASVLIDVDHYFLVLYATKFKVWDLTKAYNFFSLKHHKSHHIDAIFIFHTIEALLVVFLVYWFTKYNYILAILLGMIYHIFWDIIEVTYFKLRHKQGHKYKHMSIIWFIIKKYLVKNKR